MGVALEIRDGTHFDYLYFILFIYLFIYLDYITSLKREATEDASISTPIKTRVNGTKVLLKR